MSAWICEVYATMKDNRIKSKDLAAKIGWSEQYLSVILNKKKEPAGAEEKVRAALAEMVRSAN